MLALESAIPVILTLMSALAPQNPIAGDVVRESLRLPLTFVDLTYPPEALAARVQGFVVLELVIDEQGRVTSTQLLSGAPLLATPAASGSRSRPTGRSPLLRRSQERRS